MALHHGAGVERRHHAVHGWVRRVHPDVERVMNDTVRSRDWTERDGMMSAPPPRFRSCAPFWSVGPFVWSIYLVHSFGPFIWSIHLVHSFGPYLLSIHLFPSFGPFICPFIGPFVHSIVLRTVRGARLLCDVTRVRRALILAVSFFVFSRRRVSLAREEALVDV